jgi:hypothetical protein
MLAGKERLAVDSSFSLSRRRRPFQAPKRRSRVGRPAAVRRAVVVVSESSKGKCLWSFVRVDLIGSWSVEHESHRVPTSSRCVSHDLPHSVVDGARFATSFCPLCARDLSIMPMWRHENGKTTARRKSKNDDQARQPAALIGLHHHRDTTPNTDHPILERAMPPGWLPLPVAIAIV